MKGKMYKLTGTGLFGNAPRGQWKQAKQSIPTRKADSKPADRTAQMPGPSLPLPDKLRGK